METFELYLTLGMEHIADIRAFDHMLFIVALVCVYSWKQWRQWLILVTAFTVGHSLTLALATWDLVDVSVPLIEFLIPFTIAITAGYNIYKPVPPKANVHINYFLALFFGLIHGLGFSNYLKSLLGKETSLFQPLLAFNVGLELGQILIVLVVLLLMSVSTGIFKSSKRDTIIVLSSIVLGMSVMLLIETKFW
jgi:hypothetical protein